MSFSAGGGLRQQEGDEHGGGGAMVGSHPGLRAVAPGVSSARSWSGFRPCCLTLNGDHSEWIPDGSGSGICSAHRASALDHRFRLVYIQFLFSSFIMNYFLWIIGELVSAWSSWNIAEETRERRCRIRRLVLRVLLQPLEYFMILFN